MGEREINLRKDVSNGSREKGATYRERTGRDYGVPPKELRRLAGDIILDLVPRVRDRKVKEGETLEAFVEGIWKEFSDNISVLTVMSLITEEEVQAVKPFVLRALDLVASHEKVEFEDELVSEAKDRVATLRGEVKDLEEQLRTASGTNVAEFKKQILSQILAKHKEILALEAVQKHR